MTKIYCVLRCVLSRVLCGLNHAREWGGVVGGGVGLFKDKEVKVNSFE